MKITTEKLAKNLYRAHLWDADGEIMETVEAPKKSIALGIIKELEAEYK